MILASCLTHFFEWRRVLLCSLLGGIAQTLAIFRNSIFSICSPLPVTSNRTPSITAYEKHSNSLLFRALGKHSCCPKYYRKIICIISLGGTLPVFDCLFLERLSQGGHRGFCSGNQVGRDLVHPSFLPLLSLPFPFFWHLCPSLTKSCQLTHKAETVRESERHTLNWANLGLTSEIPEKWQPQCQTASFLKQ